MINFPHISLTKIHYFVITATVIPETFLVTEKVTDLIHHDSDVGFFFAQLQILASRALLPFGRTLNPMYIVEFSKGGPLKGPRR